MTDNEIIKALECCGNDECSQCPLQDGVCSEKDVIKHALDLITLQKAEREALIAGQETLQKYIAEQKAEIERLKADNVILSQNADTAFQDGLNEAQDLYAEQVKNEIKAEAIKGFAEKTNELLKRYSNLHKRADEARRSAEEYADGTPMEMVSVWEVLSLKKWEMADYENMNALQDNIETIAIERLLTEIEKDFKLLEKEMVGEQA